MFKMGKYSGLVTIVLVIRIISGYVAYDCEFPELLGRYNVDPSDSCKEKLENTFRIGNEEGTLLQMPKHFRVLME